MNENPQHVSRKMNFGRYDFAAFFSFFSYASGTVVLPIALVGLANDLGFDLEEGGMSEGGMLHFVRTVFVVISMLFCGVAAGRWGKRRSMGIAVLLMGAGGLLCAGSTSFVILLIALMVAGLGEGVMEGLTTPFVRDLHPAEPARYINMAHSFWPIGILSTVLVSGGLLAWGVSWRLIMAGIALFALVAAGMLLWRESEKHKYPEHPEPIHWKTIWVQSQEIFRIPRFWIFFLAMFAAGGGEFSLTYWSASYIQLNFGGTAWAGGIGTACFAGGMMLARMGWSFLLKQQQFQFLLFWSALAAVLIAMFLPGLSSLWIFSGLLFLAGIAAAPLWPTLQSHCADRLPEVDSTMLFILLSCAGIPGSGFCIWLMGFLGNQTGDLSKAFYLVPVCFCVVVLLVGYDWFRPNFRRKS
jgi:fucose permease